MAQKTSLHSASLKHINRNMMGCQLTSFRSCFRVLVMVFQSVAVIVTKLEKPPPAAWLRNCWQIVHDEGFSHHFHNERKNTWFPHFTVGCDCHRVHNALVMNATVIYVCVCLCAPERNESKPGSSSMCELWVSDLWVVVMQIGLNSAAHKDSYQSVLHSQDL